MKKRFARLLCLALALAMLMGAAVAEEIVDFLPETKPEAKDDFYGYANFDLLQDKEIPDGHGEWSSFDNIEFEIEGELNALIDEIVEGGENWEPGSTERRILDVYRCFLDREGRDAAGFGPLEPLLSAIEGAQSLSELMAAIGNAERETNCLPLLDFDCIIDVEDSSRYVLQLNKANMGIEKGYFVNPERADKVELLRDYVADLLALRGVPESEAGARGDAVVDFMAGMAAQALNAEDYDSPDRSMLPASYQLIRGLLPGIDLDAYLEASGIAPFERALIADPGQLAYIGTQLREENLSMLRDYAVAVLLDQTAPYLSMDFYERNADFDAQLHGTNQRSFEEECAAKVQELLDWEFGQMYVREFFPEESKRDVEAIVGELLAQYHKRIDELDWMGEETRAVAQRKLDKMGVKIGYPDSYAFIAWRQEAQFKSPEEGGTLIENYLALKRAEHANDATLPGTEVDPDMWWMTPQTVNAYYETQLNEIVFPAAILRGTFYDPEASRAHNLGAIGAVIGHEITHSFDNHGAQYDENGNVRMWWTEEDMAKFRELQRKVVDYYDAFEILPGIHVNGEQTLGENIADLGGVHCVSSIIGDDPEALREAYEAYAHVWAKRTTQSNMERRISTDVHAMSNARTNAVLSATDGFYLAYGVQEGDGMYVAPEDRPVIW